MTNDEAKFIRSNLVDNVRSEDTLLALVVFRTVSNYAPELLEINDVAKVVKEAREDIQKVHRGEN